MYVITVSAHLHNYPGSERHRYFSILLRFDDFRGVFINRATEVKNLIFNIYEIRIKTFSLRVRSKKKFNI